MVHKITRRRNHRATLKNGENGFAWQRTPDGIFGVKVWDAANDHVWAVVSGDGESRPLCIGFPPSIALYIRQEDAQIAADENGGEVLEVRYTVAVKAAHDIGLEACLIFPDGATADVVYTGPLSEIMSGQHDDDIPF